MIFMGEAVKNEKKSKPGFLKGFFSGVKAEFKKIIWPNRDDTVKQSIAVLIITVVVGVIIALIDAVVKQGVNFLV